MPDAIHGPYLPLASGCIMYQVTLTSGMIVTSPSGFGPTVDQPVTDMSPYDPAEVLNQEASRREGVGQGDSQGSNRP
jgi:hypothetical protein